MDEPKKSHFSYSLEELKVLFERYSPIIYAPSWRVYYGDIPEDYVIPAGNSRSWSTVTVGGTTAIDCRPAPMAKLTIAKPRDKAPWTLKYLPLGEILNPLVPVTTERSISFPVTRDGKLDDPKAVWDPTAEDVDAEFVEQLDRDVIDFSKVTIPVIRSAVFGGIKCLWKPFDDQSIWDPLDGVTIDECDKPNPQLEAICKDHDDHFWPHKNGCPLCGSDAYVGFSSVECSMGSCRNFVHREGM